MTSTLYLRCGSFGSKCLLTTQSGHRTDTLEINMQEIIPSLAQFYTIAAILFLMLLAAGISFYLNVHKITKYQRILFWLKLIISIPLLYLGIGWASRFVVVFGVLMFVSGELPQLLYFLALAFAPIVIYALTVWGLIRWSPE